MQRVRSIDMVRGAVMVFMALDHVRFFFMDQTWQPEHMDHTTPALFATRWVTHFCAPVFFLLAGTGAAVSRLAGAPRTHISRFLLTRGLWLVVLEFTLVGFGWFFAWSGFAGVIWALGVSMIVMSALVWLPVAWIAGIGLALVGLHNLLDGLTPASFGTRQWLWHLLHARGLAAVPGLPEPVFVLYPLIPWTGVMLCGYGLGSVYAWPAPRRRAWLTRAGLLACAAFVLLRATNLYGNPEIASTAGAPGHFAPRASLAMSIIAFLNVEKYPASLQYLLMTLGPALLALAGCERENRSAFVQRILGALAVFGRVPMAFYLLHLYLIHLLAIALALATKQPAQWLWQSARQGNPEGYGHGLFVVYAGWIVAVALLYGPCRWFAREKSRRKSPWLSYL